LVYSKRLLVFLSFAAARGILVFGETLLKEAEFLAKQGGYPIKIMKAEEI
jgi:hypothetical protein